MLTFTKRNILLYFRDKTTVFFSFLSVIILIALYVLFLGDMTAKGLPDFPAKDLLLKSWFIAGILTVTSMTTTLGALGILVEDKASKISMDFNASPISKAKLISGYILSAVFIGILMCVCTVILVNFYFFFSGNPTLSLMKMTQLIGVIVLSTVTSGAMVLSALSFLRTSNAFAAVSMVIGTFIGFLAGIYIPIGGLPEYLQTIVKLFPMSHAAALFRQILMETPLIEAFSNAPTEMKDTFQMNMGVFYELNGEIKSKWFSVLYLVVTTLLFFVLSLIFMRKKEQ